MCMRLSSDSVFCWVNFVALCIVNVFFAVLGIFLNLLVIMSFRNSSTLRRKFCYFLVLVLACVDLAVASLVHPLLILASIFRFIGNNSDVLFKICDRTVHLLCGVSLFVLLVMNIERYLAIVHPYFYQRSVTRQRLLALLAIFWVLEIVEGVLSFQSIFCENVAVIVITVLVFIAIGSINYKIFVIARKVRLEDASRARSYSSTEEVPCQNRVAVFKTVSTCILVVASFFVFVCPLAVDYAIHSCQTKSLPFRLWAETLLAMNSTFNCLIFFWKNNALRQEGKKLLKWSRCSNY